MRHIYLDNNATTKLAKDVLKSMLIDLKGPPSNPSSTHFFGRRASFYLKESRRNIASILKTEEREIIFTSGGSESLNMLILGFPLKKGDHVITTDIEHMALYKPCLELLKRGIDISFLKVSGYGALKTEEILKNIKSSTRLIALSYVNSETGVLTDVEEIAKIAKDKNIDFIVDGVAILGKKRFTIPEGVSSMVFSMHKVHGPKLGCTFIRKGVNISPLILGGSQEFDLRAGTENLSAILGAGKAFELIDKNIDRYEKKLIYLRDLLESLLSKELEISINGEGPRISNTTNICFKGTDAKELLILLDKIGVAASHGSACSSKSLSPSRVLINMGIKDEDALSSIRFSLSRYNKKKEIKRAAKLIIEAVKKLNRPH